MTGTPENQYSLREYKTTSSHREYFDAETLFGIFGARKFYEDKIGMGILCLLTPALAGIGIMIDFIVILTKPNPYYK